MAETLTVIGNYLSPYVRKVLVCLELKGIPYRIDPIAPFVGNEDFSRLSPLRRIPVLIEGDLVLNDSTVICEYLQDRFPAPSLYPADPVERAKARWLEEYADSYLGDVVIWRMFFQKGVRRFLFNQGTDEEVVRRAREEELPLARDYLEPRLPGDGWIFVEVTGDDPVEVTERAQIGALCVEHDGDAGDDHHHRQEGGEQDLQLRIHGSSIHSGGTEPSGYPPVGCGSTARSLGGALHN